MIRRHRTIHRLTWLLLTPLLLGLIIAFSRPHTDLSPANDPRPEIPGAAERKGPLP